MIEKSHNVLCRFILKKRYLLTFCVLGVFFQNVGSQFCWRLILVFGNKIMSLHTRSPFSCLPNAAHTDLIFSQAVYQFLSLSFSSLFFWYNSVVVSKIQIVKSKLRKHFKEVFSRLFGKLFCCATNELQLDRTTHSTAESVRDNIRKFNHPRGEMHQNYSVNRQIDRLKCHLFCKHLQVRHACFKSSHSSFCSHFRQRAYCTLQMVFH